MRRLIALAAIGLSCGCLPGQTLTPSAGAPLPSPGPQAPPGSTQPSASAVRPLYYGSASAFTVTIGEAVHDFSTYAAASLFALEQGHRLYVGANRDRTMAIQFSSAPGPVVSAPPPRSVQQLSLSVPLPDLRATEASGTVSLIDWDGFSRRTDLLTDVPVAVRVSGLATVLTQLDAILEADGTATGSDLQGRPVTVRFRFAIRR